MRAAAHCVRTVCVWGGGEFPEHCCHRRYDRWIIEVTSGRSVALEVCACVCTRTVWRVAAAWGCMHGCSAPLVAGVRVLRSRAARRGAAGEGRRCRGAPPRARWAVRLGDRVRSARTAARARVLTYLCGACARSRALAPTSLRATFGVNRVRNAVHVTDVDVDGPLECKFVFHVVSGAAAT